MMGLQNFGICDKGVLYRVFQTNIRLQQSVSLMHRIRFILSDNDVKVWDLRRTDPVSKLEGHQSMITGMQLSPYGSYLLTNSMDCSLRIWDLHPYAPQSRCVKILEGHQHNFEKNLLRCSWSADGSKVTAGSHIWETAFNECVFHPSEPIIGSCSSDKQMYLGEI